MQLFLWLDVIFALVTFLTLVILTFTGVLKKQRFFWFLCGMAIGFSWELAHALIPSFLIFAKNPRWYEIAPYILAHSIWDGLILFLSALAVVKMNLNVHGSCALVVLLILGLGLEFLVEFICNGRVWTYNEALKCNPVLFRINKVGFTLWPFL
jgi:hypothetical protein